MLNFTEIQTNISTCMQKAEVPGGWLVIISTDVNNGDDTYSPLIDPIFIPDPDHRWDLDETVPDPPVATFDHYENECKLKDALQFTYTNYKGSVANRSVIPIRLWYGHTKFHQQDQWILKAYDTLKKEERDFAVSDITKFF